MFKYSTFKALIFFTEGFFVDIRNNVWKIYINNLWVQTSAEIRVSHLVYGSGDNKKEKGEEKFLFFLNYFFVEIPFLLVRLWGRVYYSLPTDVMMLKNMAEMLELIPDDEEQKDTEEKEMLAPEEDANEINERRRSTGLIEGFSRMVLD